MRIRYQSGAATLPIPSLAGGRVRYRPMTSVQITGPAGSALRDGLVDTGADDTVFPEQWAPNLGLNLANLPQYSIHLAGRGVLTCRYATVTLRLTDGVSETYEWDAVVGFVNVPIRAALLGHAGFLQFFDATFFGADHEMLLVPNRSFTGKRIP